MKATPKRITDPKEVEEAFEDYSAVEECTAGLQQAPSEPQEDEETLEQRQRWLHGYFTLNRLRTSLKMRKDRSAWARGVTEYALELIEDESEDMMDALGLKSKNCFKWKLIRDELLRGVDSWHSFSYGGCSLIYDEDIAKRLCSPSELKRTHNGMYDPNPEEMWLDVQERALFQAEQLIMRTLQDNGDLTR